MSQVTGKVNWVLRAEGFCILVLAAYVLHHMKFSWATFAIFFLAPDLSFLGYLISKKIGAIAYNTAHSLIGSCAILGIGISLANKTLLIAGLIWCAHIGFDRALGYGLKYAKGFGYTHLGLIGNNRY